MRTFSEMCAADMDRALALAMSHKEPWRKCQLLAHVAWHTSNRKQFERLIKNALAAAHALNDPNRTVTVASWPVRAIAERPETDLTEIITELVDLIDREPKAVCRADALIMLFEAAYKKHSVRSIILPPLLDACRKSYSWKKQRLLKYLALILAIDDLPASAEVVELIEDQRIRRQTERLIAEKKWLGPHEFFPNYAKP